MLSNAPRPATLHSDQALLADLQNLDQLWNPAPNPYADNPVAWVHHEANSETWSKQDEIYKAVQNNRYTAVRSCHGPGKSYTAANLIEIGRAHV